MLGMELKPEDRGWNDPPIVDFSDANQSHKRGRLLNKRVAFPINASNTISPNMGAGYPMRNSAVQNQPMQPTIPSASQENYMYSGTQGVPSGNNYYPPNSENYYPQQPQPNQYPQANTQATFMSSGIVEQPPPIQYRQPSIQPSNTGIGPETKMQLEESLHPLRAMMNTIPPHLVDEVSQCLQVMETMWKENRLPPEVCDLLFQMSVALRQGNRDYAESFLSSISTNHFECCREWISGPSAILQAASSQPGGN